MTNAERYLNSFATIEKLLKKKLGAGNGKSFYQLVDLAAQRDREVRRYALDLKEYADLRNAIVHERSDGHVIAEPNDRAVGRIDQIKDLLIKPPTVIPAFQRPVIAYPINASLGQLVHEMLRESISQVPVYDGEEFKGVLSSNTITRWLGHSVDDDLVSLNDTRLAAVMEYVENRDIHRFVGRYTTVLEAVELFHAYEDMGKSLDAVLITQNGKSTEKILGIMTVSDLPQALKVTAVN